MTEAEAEETSAEAGMEKYMCWSSTLTREYTVRNGQLNGNRHAGPIATCIHRLGINAHTRNSGSLKMLLISI